MTMTRSASGLSACPAPRALVSLFLAGLLAAAPACSRGVAVGAPPSPVFAVSVSNQTRVELLVSYDDGAGPKALGAVAAGRSERFVIAAPAAATIDVLGRSQDGSVSATARGVRLVAGQTVQVALSRS